jgi:hypothetical protein
MSLAQILFGNSEEVNRRYAQIRDSNIRKGFQQAKEKNVDVPTEPFRIAKMVPLPGAVDGKHYWGIADFIIAEYPTELALQVATAFCNMAPKLGFDPFGKIMVGAQYVDINAGSLSIARFSFIKEHLDFYEYTTERECPERTEKALDFLTAAVFQFDSADYAKRIFPNLLVVSEMERGVKEKMYSIDEAVAKYIIR